MPSEWYVVATVPSAQLKRALQGRARAFANERAVAAVRSPDDNCIGEHSGSTYIFDGEMTLAIGASPDLFTNLSGELDTTVVACGYETVSGTYRFLAAERGKVLRYLSTSSNYRKPLTMGSPLPSEVRTPLHTVEGIHAALRCLGFDVEGWHESGSKVWFEYPDEFRLCSLSQMTRALPSHSRMRRVSKWRCGSHPRCKSSRGTNGCESGSVDDAHLWRIR
jgi:hypothetical protein